MMISVMREGKNLNNDRQKYEYQKCCKTDDTFNLKDTYYSKEGKYINEYKK